MPPAKLKNLSVTSVDLVDQGANPDAYIRLFKRKEDEPETGNVEKEQEEIEQVGSQHDMGGGDPPDISKLEQEVTETMRIDKSKMTPEEAATLAEFEKKYGVAEEPAAEPVSQGGVEKGADPTPAPASAELHPEVQKALADLQALTKQRDAEVEELKKSLEIERLTAAAKKYEVLGKNAGELAVKLYELKKAGGTVYNDYVSLLDENVETLTKSGLFGEIGSNRQGGAGSAQSLKIKAAELAKSASGGMSSPEAIIKAFEENPELAAQYEAEYMGGR